MPTRTLSATFLLMLLAVACPSAMAWSVPGHMVSAAIAYEELRLKDPRLAHRIVELMSQHPDRAPFAVAINGASDEARTRRIFMEMARWPDDVRGGAYDHPTWHYASRPIVDPRHPPAAAPPDVITGSAIEAFALNASVASDAHAPAAERAIALCWIFHLVGDIHQPLHAADQFSSAYPDGDRGGNREHVLDPQTQQPVTLHGYWDNAVSRSGEVEVVLARANELRAKFPRERFSGLASPKNAANDFTAWARESYALARSQAYRDDLSASATQEKAPALSAAYIADSTNVAEQRLTLAGYRLADLLVVLLRE
jgi:hypothetical protein